MQGICGIAWETHMASVPNWIIERKVNFLVQLGLEESGADLVLDSLADLSPEALFAHLAKE